MKRTAKVQVTKFQTFSTPKNVILQLQGLHECIYMLSLDFCQGFKKLSLPYTWRLSLLIAYQFSVLP